MYVCMYVHVRAGTDPAFTIRISFTITVGYPGNFSKKIHDLFALKYTVLPHFFGVLVYLQIILLSKRQKSW